MPRKLNLLGWQFARLTAIEEAPSKQGRRAYRCSCICGGEVIALVSNLVHGRTKSCGYLAKEAIQKAKTTHGASARVADTGTISSVAMLTF